MRQVAIMHGRRGERHAAACAADPALLPPTYDPGALDALIAAGTSDMVAVSRAELALLSTEVRLGNEARIAMARLAGLRGDAPAGHRPGIARS